jgi:hypothetical protein
MAKTPTAKTTGPTGAANARAFFDLVENPASGEGLRGALQRINGDIIALAKGVNLVFDYDDMQDELERRWGVQNPNRQFPRFCCT